MRHAVNLGLDDNPVPLAAHLGALAGAPVVVDNDVNLAAVGAAVALGCRGDLAYLSVGTGLAAGLLLDGRIRRGAHGAAGEIGHLPIDPHGPLCECGQRGCLEARGLGNGHRRPVAGARRRGRPPRRRCWRRPRPGDAEAAAVLDEVAGHLAGAVALLAQTVDPEVVVLGGGVADAGPGLLDGRAGRAAAAGVRGRRCWRRSTWPTAWRSCPRACPPGRSGAAVVARRHLRAIRRPIAALRACRTTHGAGDVASDTS